jgi:uncharacterized YigZ family protein
MLQTYNAQQQNSRFYLLDLFRMQGYSYKTIVKTGKGEFSDRGSRFIGYAFEVTSRAVFKERYQSIVDLHPKASHFCFAFRVGHEGQDWRCSDNGEPSGTAGRPILGQLDSFELVNAAVVVVRYFGGTLLGVPGLINAYRSAAQLALQHADIVEKPKLKMLQLEFDYTLEHEIYRLVKQFSLSIEKSEKGLFSQLTVGVPLLQFVEANAAFSAVNGLTYQEVVANKDSEST